MSHGERLVNLKTRLEAREKVEGSLDFQSMMSAEIGTLKVYVNQLRSMDISLLWGEVTCPDAPEDMPTNVPNVAEYE